MTDSAEKLSPNDINRIIQMAWEDRTPLEAISIQFGLSDKVFIILMRSHLNTKSFRRWRARTKGRMTKHKLKTAPTQLRFKSSLQRDITHNKISKR